VDEDRGHQAWVEALVQTLQNGTVLDLAPGEDVDESQAAGWPASRRLPGKALRAALLNSDVQPDPRGLRIRAAYITGVTDLADLTLPFGLHFDSCAFEQSAKWSRITLTSLRLTSCTTPGLVLSQAHIGGILKLDPVTVYGEVRARGATIGELNLAGTLTNEGDIALDLDRADIKGRAALGPVDVTGEVRAVGATIVELYLTGILTNEGGVALALDRADIKGDAYLTPVTVTGEVRVRDATIGGELNLEDASLTNSEKLQNALALQHARIGGVVLTPKALTGVSLCTRPRSAF